MSVLDDVRLPTTWPRVRLDSAFTRSFEANAIDLEPLSVFTDDGVVPRASKDHSYKALGDDLAKNLRVRPGDLVFNKLRTWQGAIGVSAFHGIVSPAYFVLRPKRGVDPRFFHYLLRSSPWVQELRRVSKYMPPNQNDISWDDLKRIGVPLPPSVVQQAVADYLDTETARIDALIAKKQRMIELLVTRRLSAIEGSLGGGRGAGAYLVGSDEALHRAVPMKRLLSATIAGGTPDSNDSDYWTDDPDGVAWVAIGDMVDCSATTKTARRLTPAGLAASRLRVAPAGTLLFAMYASLGKLTVTAVPCVWNQAIIGLVPDRTQADAEYLALWLEALRPHLPLLARSTTQDNLNAEQVCSLPVPLINVEEQRTLVRGLLPVLQQLSAARGVLERQIDLLREHRQALITAAVTDELEVPGVAA